MTCIKRIALSCILSVTCGLNIYAQHAPNVILIIADDVSRDDIGCYGNTSIRTPNIDRLAKEGMKFTNVFVTSSSCSPSRSSIITGRYPHNTGAAELHTPLPAHLTFFPEIIKAQGYYTAQAGKWHEGENTKRAYDTMIVGDINGAGGESMWMSLLKDRPKNKPFFFWLAPYDAHREWQADSLNTPHDPAKVNIPSSLVDTRETREDIAAYYNEIARLDYYIGRLENELQVQGIANNTMIIFMSDNGRPFPGSKTRLNDAGVKSPFIIKWPEYIDKGSECTSLVSAIDIAPTLLELTGAKSSVSIQGKSFSRLLKKPKTSFRSYIFTEHNWHDYEAYERAVRTNKYLFIINRRPQLANQGPLDAVNSRSFNSLVIALKKEELTSIQKDIFFVPRPAEELYVITNDEQTETPINNSAASKKLRHVLTKWQEQTGDTEPVQLTPDWYDRVNGNKTKNYNKRGEMPGQSKNADKINSPGPF